MQLAGEREASEPPKQFSAQVEEERRRILNTDLCRSWTEINPGDGTFMEEPRETVKKRWVEQGIWSGKWNQFALGLWKHEEPLELESEWKQIQKQNPYVYLFFSPRSSVAQRATKRSDGL
jgi:hypothetical protein